jgi:hypothetical protein
MVGGNRCDGWNKGGLAMRNKRIILTACLLVSVSIIILLWFKYATKIKEFFGFKEFEITTTYGDHFLVKSKDDLIGPGTTYKLYYLRSGAKRTFVLEFWLKEFDNFSYQYRDNHIRAYIIADFIVYAKKHETVFKAIPIYKADLKRERSVIPVARYFLFDPDVDGVKFAAIYLIKSRDSKVINILKKYADGEFTAEQKKWNNRLDLKEFQEFSKKLLRENGIK